MKISELIKKLSELQDKVGDVDVVLYDYDISGLDHISNITLENNELDIDEPLYPFTDKFVVIG